MNRSLPLTRTDKKQIGAFFTPLDMAETLIQTYNIHRTWASGATILDPTAGNGRLLEALIRTCQKNEIPITEDMLGRLKGYEREKEFILGFKERIEKTYSLTIPQEMLSQRDFLRVEPESWDILLGNPPWLNFTDLPEEEKEDLKVLFRHYGLVGRGRHILLGHSRIDLAALIIQKAMQDHLRKGGEAYFFIPLSLLLNEGAHNTFRKGILAGDCFSFLEIRDFGTNKIFRDVNTRCGFTVLKKSMPPKDRIPYLTLMDGGQWKREMSGTVGKLGSCYRILDDELSPPLIRIAADSRPRQGINTGGRNQIFIFDRLEKEGKDTVRLYNKSRSVLLPDQLVYPLITSEQFKGNEAASRYIFLPYKRNGKVLGLEEIRKFPLAYQYLSDQKDQLTSRKGSMLGSTMKMGKFWTLLGVGPYTFSSWKVVWEAYGKKDFNPRIFHTLEEKPWIPNQALQAACSFESEEEARRVLVDLKHPGINKILKQQNMEGTCNWAQPGRMAHFMQYVPD